MIEPRIYKELGLSDDEYQKIEKTLGREPTLAELAMFSVEWSEHCGYPRSKKYLKLFPQKGKFETLVGEDAGGIVYDGLALIFKMESHNHPSQVEPKQGAATGVGGILRDIFTSGARPIALLDSLRFGELEDPFARFLFSHVVEGIAFYGNCVGVPTVGGEVYFEESYSGNCLVNVMCLGVTDRKKIMRAKATGIGNSIMYVGSSTGRDGIGGCSVLASHEFCEGEEKRPTVQIGDPFTEKCLIEATLEALETGHIVGIKDMGAAGLTCSTSEMAAAGGVGIEIDIDKVPKREEGMEPWEVMMSESQERMLACVKKGKEKEIEKIFSKWGLNAVVIGTVTDNGLVCVKDCDKVVAQIKAKDLASPPIYDMPYEEPSYIKEIRDLDLSKVLEPKDYNDVLIKILNSPNIASKSWVYEQYDHMVQTNTVVLPGSDSAVLRIKGKKWGVALTTDCNGRYCYLNPYRGAQIAVAEASRNLVCSGAEPAGLTDCLNFGNPEKKDRFWQFRNCVMGLADACRELNIPVVSGNVSFYNESPKGAIYPTPTIGMVGIIRDINKRCTIGFKNFGDKIVLLGETKNELGGSEYLKVIHGIVKGDAPFLDLKEEISIQRVCLEAIEQGIVNSAHDISDGGLVVAILECIFYGNEGARGAIISLNQNLRNDVLLFSESQSRILVSLADENLSKLEKIANKYAVPIFVIGSVSEGELKISVNGRKIIDVSPLEVFHTYKNGLSKFLES